MKTRKPPHLSSLIYRGLFCALAVGMVLLNPAFAEENSPVSLERFEFEQPQMGVKFKLLFYAIDEKTANFAANAAFAQIAALDQKLSDYNPQSELNRLSRTAGRGEKVAVSDDLWQVLVAAEQISQQSAGAFDVTVGPAVRLWRRARRSQKMPSVERLEQARQAIGYRFIELDPERQEVELTQPGMQLDLGAIAKGYAADRALQVLKEHGIGRAMVDASGDLALGTPPPGQPGWRIGIAPLAADAPPSRYYELSHCGVATSGDAWQFVELEGKRYSHIVDPHTALGLTERSSVTIIAKNGMLADSLASAVSVLGLQRGLELVDSIPDAAAVIVIDDEGKTVTHASKRMACFKAVEN